MACAGCSQVMLQPPFVHAAGVQIAEYRMRHCMSRAELYFLQMLHSVVGRTRALGPDTKLGHFRRAKQPMGVPQLFQHGDEHDACEAAETLLDAAVEELRAWCRAALLDRLSTPSLQHLADICMAPLCQGMLPPLLMLQCVAEVINMSVVAFNSNVKFDGSRYLDALRMVRQSVAHQGCPELDAQRMHVLGEQRRGIVGTHGRSTTKCSDTFAGAQAAALPSPALALQTWRRLTSAPFVGLLGDESMCLSCHGQGTRQLTPFFMLSLPIGEARTFVNTGNRQLPVDGQRWPKTLHDLLTYLFMSD